MTNEINWKSTTMRIILIAFVIGITSLIIYGYQHVYGSDENDPTLIQFNQHVAAIDSAYAHDSVNQAK